MHILYYIIMYNNNTVLKIVCDIIQFKTLFNEKII